MRIETTMPGMTNSSTALPLSSCIGFNGSVGGGLVLEKDASVTTVIYPLGSTIIVRQLHNDQQQTFLQGHTDEVRCISPSTRLCVLTLATVSSPFS